MRGSWNYKMTKMLPAELLDLHHLAEELIHTSGKFLRTLLLLPEGLIINLQAKTLSHVASGKLCFAWSVSESSASVNTLYKVFINILSHLRCPSIQHDLIQSPHATLAYVCDAAVAVEVPSEALHPEALQLRAQLMDSTSCLQSGYATVLTLRPGFSWAAFSQDLAWRRLLVLAHFCLTQPPLPSDF